MPYTACPPRDVSPLAQPLPDATMGVASGPVSATELAAVSWALIARRLGPSRAGGSSVRRSELEVPDQLTLCLRWCRTSSDGNSEEAKHMRKCRVAGYHFDRAAHFDGSAVKNGPAFEVAEAGNVSDTRVERMTMFVCL